MECVVVSLSNGRLQGGDGAEASSFTHQCGELRNVPPLCAAAIQHQTFRFLFSSKTTSLKIPPLDGVRCLFSQRGVNFLAPMQHIFTVQKYFKF